jgi:hypothetical protein
MRNKGRSTDLLMMFAALWAVVAKIMLHAMLHAGDELFLSLLVLFSGLH